MRVVTALPDFDGSRPTFLFGFSLGGALAAHLSLDLQGPSLPDREAGATGTEHARPVLQSYGGCICAAPSLVEVDFSLLGLPRFASAIIEWLGAAFPQLHGSMRDPHAARGFERLHLRAPWTVFSVLHSPLFYPDGNTLGLVLAAQRASRTGLAVARRMTGPTLWLGGGADAFFPAKALRPVFAAVAAADKAFVECSPDASHLLFSEEGTGPENMRTVTGWIAQRCAAAGVGSRG